MKAVRQQMMEWSAEDWDLLLAIAHTMGQTRSQIVRWALRYYAAEGPWAMSPSDRSVVVGSEAALEVGPDLRRIPS